MAGFLHRLIFVRRKWCAVLLALCFGAGLFLGAAVYQNMGMEHQTLIPAAAAAPLRVLTAVFCALLPLVVTGFLLSLDMLRLLYGLGFCKAFLFAYVSCAAVSAFPSGGWLIRWLLLFTDSCCILLLYLCWHRLLTGKSSSVHWSWGAICCTVAILDAVFIAPLLQRVLL